MTVRQGTKYGPEYVTALKKQVPGIVSLGDDRPLQSEFFGWHAKIELFAPWNKDLRPFLFFDLDTYVPGNLSPFNDLDLTQFWMIDDFNRPKFGESGILLVPDSEISDKIWNDRFQMNLGEGDGAFFRNFSHLRLNDAISGIYSYKLHAKAKMPHDARIICFHGKPKPPETDGWSQRYWTLMTT